MEAYSIDIESFANQTMNSDEIHLLDIRNKADFQNWSVSGRNIHPLNIPFSEMADRLGEISRNFSPEQPLYVLCYKGILAQKAASMLRADGYSEAKFIQGGMKAWGEHQCPVKIGDLSRGGAIYQFIRVGKGCLSYMVISDNEVLVVDPGRNIDPYLALASQHGWQITQVADTHLHADHISGGRELSEHTGASYWFPCKDGSGARMHYSRLEDGIRIPIGSGKETVFSFSSPGHTEGSMSFLIDDVYLLCGDCLFIGSAGRPDLAGKTEEWAKQLRTTLFSEFKQLPEQLIVLPAHFGEFSEVNAEGSVQATLKELYRDNPVLQLETEEAFFRAMTRNLPEQPNSYQTIRRINIGLHKADIEEQQEIESGPNRCAVD